MSLQELVDDLKNKNFIVEILEEGGDVYVVGGAVRDVLLNKINKDIDLVVRLIEFNKLVGILDKYGKVDVVGESFGVIKLNTIDGEYDIALPRKEKINNNIGGHKGFDVTSDILLPIEDDLCRRDATLNSIALRISDGDIIDPTNGLSDINDNIIRMTNPNTFSDDPLRMLRMIIFAARFEMYIEDETEKLIKSNAHKISEITGERILEEFKKVITKNGDPLYAADLLRETGLFAEITGVVPFNPLWSAWWDMDVWEHIETFGEFMFLLLYTTGNPVEIFRDRLKGDTDTLNEITALCMAYDSDKSDVADIRYELSLIFKKSAGVIQSKILPTIMEEQRLILNSEKYPLSISGLKINGYDLMKLGYSGREVGDALILALKKIYANEVGNYKKDLLNLFRK